MIYAFAIPFFFILIAIEFLAGKKANKGIYRINDAVTDLSCGVGNLVTGVLMDGAIFGLYVALYNYGHLFELSADSILTWIVATILVDFAYYWWHRASHRINFIWAAHVVHHQSQDYNLAVALRQAWFTRCTIWAFNLPMALIGVPPLVFAISVAINTLYQFWIHTQLVGKMGFLESFLNTPSHHRVHHGINPKYIDKNYAGFLIIWDRMFGTFCEEDEPVVYGTVKPFKSFDPIWANFHYWVEMAVLSWRAPQIKDKLKVWFMPPEWSPAELGGTRAIPEVNKKTFKKWEVRLTNALALYLIFQFATVVLATMYLLISQESATENALVLLGATIILSTWVWGFLLRGWKWALIAEHVRLILLPLIAFIVMLETTYLLPALIGVGLFSIISVYWLFFRSAPIWPAPVDSTS